MEREKAMASKGKGTDSQFDETTLRAELINGVQSVEFPDGGASVRFVSDMEYRRVMKARGYDPDADFHEFMDAEDFTGAIRVKMGGVGGLLCTT